MAISTVEWYEMVLFSTAYNFGIDSSSILRQAIFNNNFSRNIRACLDISFSKQLALKSRARVIYTYASPIYCGETDMAYN